MGVNGEQQVARFSFETFRFVEHRNKTVSTFYLHCTTRLCESSFCRSLRQNCTTPGRTRRAVQSAQGTSVSDFATVSSRPIVTKVDEPFAPVATVSKESKQDEVVVGVSVAAGVFGGLCLIMLAVLIYKIRKDKFSADKSSLFH
ncbi:zona pellucida-like domain-containing protein 1 [Sinocyclocheilus rhinocerous]|uniref:zona pellucida-like domain-containing protein 1 n=1 Tax=Sinocyclocheilus rhinocerous TaxID=307959 RepID=UPI0007B7AFDF|nr:PREDICTED: zona pellucida-like domain-containing protein 1 [Sinocyclocheilus rhinocerous]